ncbi:PGN_0703 family putative restriction endonuclease [Xanthobacter variabilis]|uniref:PGN_0703 family putative restriction endonuclease n=1 Tax=Xanthobacter variabilis TaxID=3119932 RepID=UPI00372706AC
MSDNTYGYENSLLPIVPREILQHYHVNELDDTRFASCARLLQSIWRESRGLAPGWHRSRDGRQRILGSRLDPDDARRGRNLLTPDIARLTRRATAYREIGAFIEEQRLWENLLSSQPLTFNLFARCQTAPDHGLALFNHLFPGFFGEVRKLAFEHSPGRGDPTYLGDYTAFDLFVSGLAPDGSPAFIAIEMKYSEAMRQPGRSSTARYRELTRTCALHLDPEAPGLLADPLVQLTAEHLLAALIRERLGPGARAIFVVIAPAGNRDVWNAVDLYRTMLADRTDSVPFMALTLEAVIAAIGETGDPDLAARLHERYTDFTPVHRLIEDWEPFSEE